MRRRVSISLCLLALGLLLPAHAGAVMSDATTIDGPSADIVGFGGVAMAEDGSGGLVYLKRVDGHTHVFASRFGAGGWSAPERIDTGQRFDSTFPAIGAGDGGRLVVVWAQDFGTGTDRLFSASLDPGATRFQDPVVIDFNVGEDQATYPQVAMNRGGQALLTYRYTPDVDRDQSLPPGYINADVRLQRYNGSFWSQFGAVVDRNPAQPVLQPDAGNSPKVGIDVTGQGVVAWQEPDDDFVDRIWARRVFPGGTTGIPLLVSPQTYRDKPLRGPADEFSLDEAGFGETAVAFRQQPGQGSAMNGTRVMVNQIPDQYTDGADKFAGARVIDGSEDAPPAGTPGMPSIGVEPRGGFLAAFGVGGAAFGVPGDEGGSAAPARLDDGSGSAPADPVVDRSTDAATAAAWKAGDGTSGTVVLREERADGVVNTKSVTGSRGGPIGTLALAGSGLGDAAAAWLQGGREYTQIAAAAIDAPPQAFAVHTPTDYVRTRRYRMSWDPAPHGVGGVTYTALVDDEEVSDPVAGTRVTLGPDQLEDGRHELKVIATDTAGQETETPAGRIKVDRSPPRVRVNLRGRKVRVRVRDGASGAVRGDTTIAWGDGRTTRGRVQAQRALRPGRTYSLRVTVIDRAGNRAVIRRKLRVR